ncbi:MAG: hypothetical protein IJ005_02035, partial [Bacteroidales bacterium]|nr:hypothetical protein [Bacteroidales bacterium]
VKAQHSADIDKAHAELAAAWHAASEDMAKAAQAGQQAGPQPGAQGPFQGGDDNNDVEEQ